MAATAQPGAPPREGMTWIAGGTFAMGSEDFYPEERPVRQVAVDGFWIDTAPVTVARFRRFVRATGWVTVAERELDPAPGSLVFHPTAGPVPLDDFRQWWSYVEGACWHQPEGPGSDTYTRGKHPVVHVTPEDAEAYANWAGASLPTEAEWEFAAAGEYELVNRWYGEFPWRGYRGTSPVGAFPPNARGLLDIVGNVWEWTADPYELAHGGCCGGTATDEAPRRVIKGGSHLCAPTYCHRYRPAALQGEAIDTSTSHIGFRCIVRP
ncbi:MAG TPA: formylglycine-generating enzyme family protein [Solirubrobacter sp.]